MVPYIHIRRASFLTALSLCIASMIVLPGCRKKRKKPPQEAPATVEQVSQACLDARAKIEKAKEANQSEMVISILQKTLDRECQKTEGDAAGAKTEDENGPASP